MQTLITTIVLLVVALLMDAEKLSAAEIRGNVALRGVETKAPARYVVRGQNPAGSGTTASGMVAVAVEPLDSRRTPVVTDTPYVMAQENTSFAPNLLVVPVGARVTFPNRDAIFHNVFSYSPPRSFDLGRYPKGETRTVRFEESGIVRIFCEIHASMYATILVVPWDRYQLLNSQDGFSFPDLPAGQYRVVAVDASGRRAKSDIDLKNGQIINVSLTLE